MVISRIVKVHLHHAFFARKFSPCLTCNLSVQDPCIKTADGLNKIKCRLSFLTVGGAYSKAEISQLPWYTNHCTTFCSDTCLSQKSNSIYIFWTAVQIFVLLMCISNNNNTSVQRNKRQFQIIPLLVTVVYKKQSVCEHN